MAVAHKYDQIVCYDRIELPSVFLGPGTEISCIEFKDTGVWLDLLILGLTLAVDSKYLVDSSGR